MTGQTKNLFACNVASAVSRNPDGIQAIQEVCREALAKSKMKQASWCIVFANIHYLSDYREMLTLAAKIIGTHSIAGCSASGILTEQGEINRPPAVGVLLGSDPRIRMQPFLLQGLKKKSRKIAEEILQNLPEDARTIILFPDIFQLDSEEFFGVFNDFNKNRKTPIKIVGGAPSSENPVCGTVQFAGTEIVQGGVSGFYLCGGSRCHVGVSQACKPITQIHEVTACEGRWILEINGEPAYKILCENVPEPLLGDPKRLIQYVFLAVPADSHQPLEQGNYLVRNIVGIDARENIIACSGKINKGMNISFALRNGDSSRENLKNVLKALKEDLNGDQPQFGIYFNCCARGPELYGMDDIDTSYISQEFQTLPFIGLASFGEIGPISKEHFLQTYSGILMLA